ncbi:hypothetical protein KJ909_03535 [Patescibacteria group bacterium]|nr:hypothetical protein [Patescibacteria group bacterium]
MAKRKTDKAVKEKIEKVEETKVEVKKTSKSAKTIKIRSKAYKKAKAKIDVSQFYPLDKAIKLVQETSFSKFDGKIEAHVNTSLEPGKIGEISFPYLKAESKKVVIATDSIIKDIQDGKINFDILIATPQIMPKILPLAKILGPKGLMPNPKNGTLTDKPEIALKKLSAAATPLQTEKKGPLIHIVVGQVSQNEKELIANVKELIKAVNPIKIKKLVLCATMGPAIKVEIK